jgi:hypothetical protein
LDKLTLKSQPSSIAEVLIKEGAASTASLFAVTVPKREKNNYSCVHISSDELFSKILKKPLIVQKKIIPHMKAFGLFYKIKQYFLLFLKKKIQNGRLKKKGYFPAPPILNIFL